ncbi:MAG: hypothetical protein JO212_16855 [Acetobacteraceae bacterium]|nr:hypothetical protein [Acetobacteraceae bacterium]
MTERFLPVTRLRFSVFVLAAALVWPLAAAPADAAYTYNIEEIAPSVASNLTMQQIAAILNETGTNAPYLVAYALSATEANGTVVSAAPLKVVQTDDPNCPYLGVYHNAIPNSTKFTTYLGCSSDLRTWTERGAVHSDASQPDIRILSDDSVLYADEADSTGRPYVYVAYYGNTAKQTGLQALVANPAVAPTNSITLPGTFLATANGTPEFGRINYSGSILSSTIEINYHYYYLGIRDLDAVGTMTNFKSWSGSSDTQTNNLVTNAGGNGKIGDSEVFEVGSTVYKLVEAQVNPPSSGDTFGSWRLFLVNKTAGTVQQLSPALAGGALSLGNPTLTFLTHPNGTPALVFTCYIFAENDNSTLPGGHIYVYPLQPQ